MCMVAQCLLTLVSRLLVVGLEQSGAAVIIVSYHPADHRNFACTQLFAQNIVYCTTDTASVQLTKILKERGCS